MHKLIRVFFIVALMVFGHLFSFSAKVRTAQQQEVPAELRAPENERLLLQVRGKGDQIYTCKEDGGKTAWTLKATSRIPLAGDWRFISIALGVFRTW